MVTEMESQGLCVTSDAAYVATISLHDKQLSKSNTQN